MEHLRSDWWLRFGVLAAALFVLAGCARAAEAPAPIPSDLEDQAVANFEGRYGQVSEVFATAATSMAEWREAEPGNTSGLAQEEGESDKVVYALFVRGDFTVVGPPSSGKHAVVNYGAGRFVIDASGRILSVQLWPSDEKDPPFSNADPPFSSAFDG